MATSPLQKTPIGLLQAYNLQTLGQAPIGFSDTVVPVTLADPYYLRDLVQPRTVSTNVAIGQASAQIGLSVPAPEQGWVLYGASANFTFAAADGAFTSTLGLRILLGGTAAVGLTHAVTQVGAGVILGRFCEFWFPQPFLLRSGDRLEAFVETSSVLTVASSFNLITCAAVY